MTYEYRYYVNNDLLTEKSFADKKEALDFVKATIDFCIATGVCAKNPVTGGADGNLAYWELYEREAKTRGPIARIELENI